MSISILEDTMLYDELVPSGEWIAHDGKRGMRWSEAAKAKNRHRRRRKPGSSWQSAADDNRTRLKKPGSGSTRSSSNTGRDKPAGARRQNDDGWSKPKPHQNKPQNNKGPNKKRTKKTANKRPTNVKAKALKSAEEKIKRGK